MAFAKYVNGMRDPRLPFMANAILDFHFCFWNPSLLLLGEDMVQKKCSFLEHFSKGGGVIPMLRNYVVNFVKYKGPFGSIK